MATTGNRDLAFVEAKRRASVMKDAYCIYRHRSNTDDYIIRNAAAAAPQPNNWQLAATFQSDGSQSFTAESAA